MQLGVFVEFSRRGLAVLAAAAALLASGGCGGGGEEPSEVPKSPPPGQGLPKFAEALPPSTPIALR